MTKIFISGYFNVLHPGHIRLLRFAKDLGGELIVGVYADDYRQEKSLVKQNLRFDAVQSISWVGKVLIINDSLLDVLNHIRPDVIVKGREFEGKPNEEDDYIKHSGAKLIFSSGDSFFSSFDLIGSELKNKKNFLVPHGYIKRHKIDTAKLVDQINLYKNLKVLVIGDVIVDEYISCEPLGMSQEDPTLVVKEVDSKRYLGGAGIVAAHAASLGSEVNFISVVGNDEEGEFVFSALKEYQVNPIVLIDDSRPTTLKKRYRAKGKTLLRVSDLNQIDVSFVIQQRLYDYFIEHSEGADLVVFSDFSYGVLPEALVNKISRECFDRKIMMIADSQSSSQNGNIFKFKNVSLLTPTEREARLGANNFTDGLVVLSEKVQEQANTKNIFLKLNEDGVIVCTRVEGANNAWHTDKIEALNSFPIDTAGAGDSMLISAGLSLAAGSTIWEAAYIGSIAAALQVANIGNTPLKVEELLSQIKKN